MFGVGVYVCFSAEGMKAGNYGNLLVLIEQPRGEYSVTIAFLSLVTTLVKVMHLSPDMTNHVKMTKFLANHVSLQYTDYIVRLHD